MSDEYRTISVTHPPAFGAPVFYRQTCRGGYGFQRWVPAVWRGIRGSRASIEVTPANAPDRRKVIRVAPWNVFLKIEDA